MEEHYSLSEESFGSWHTCREENINQDQQYTKLKNENIIKDLNFTFSNDSDTDSFNEFERIVNESGVFSKFKENESPNNYFRPEISPSDSLKLENSSSLPKLLKPNYFNSNDKINITDKTHSTNMYANNIEIIHEVPSIRLNGEKYSSDLSSIPGNKNNLPIQSSTVTLINADVQDDVSIPGGNLALFENNTENSNVNNTTENNEKNSMVEGFKNNLRTRMDNFKKRFSRGSEEMNVTIPDPEDEFKDAKQEIKETEVVSENKENNENDQGTLGRFFGYFKGFGKTESSENVAEEVKEDIKVSNDTTKLDDQNKMHPPFLGTEFSATTMVNIEFEEDKDSEDEFANALEVQPEPESINNNNNNSLNENKIKNSFDEVKDTVVQNSSEINVEPVSQKIGNEDDIKSPQYDNYENKVNIPVPIQNNIHMNEVKIENNVVPVIPNEAVIESYSNSQEYGVKPKRSNNSLGDEVQCVTNVNSLEIPNRVDSALITKNDQIILENKIINSTVLNPSNTVLEPMVEQDIALEPAIKPSNTELEPAIKPSNTELEPAIKPSNTELEPAIKPLNNELEPVIKPLETLEEVPLEVPVEETDITDANKNELAQPYGDNLSQPKKSKKSHRIKEKMKKWYHKVFRFAICNRQQQEVY